MRTITLDAAPNLTVLMARAVATAAGRGGSLPDVEVQRAGVVVDRNHLAAYDRICGFTVRDTLPASYLHVLTFGLQLTLMAEPGYPMPLPGMVHVANRLELLRPVGVAEPLDLSVRAQSLRAHPRGRQVDVVGTATVGGEVVWRGLSTYLAKGSSSGLAGEELPLTPKVSFDPKSPPQARWRLGADLGRRYAAVSGDANPMHLSPLAAKAFGFPRTIAHGMWSLARCLAALESWAPEAAVTDIEFRRPVLLPGTVELRTRSVDDGWELQLSSRGGDARATEHLRGSVRQRQ